MALELVGLTRAPMKAMTTETDFRLDILVKNGKVSQHRYPPLDVVKRRQSMFRISDLRDCSFESMAERSCSCWMTRSSSSEKGNALMDQELVVDLGRGIEEDGSFG